MTNLLLPGDAIAVLPTLAAGSVHTCVTSPPYWGLRSYGVDPTDWPAVTFTPAAGLPPLTIEPMTCCLGLEPEPWAFVAHLVQVFREVRRVLREDGTAWVNLGDSYNSSPSNMQDGEVYREGYNQGYNAIGRQSRQIPGLKPKDLVGIPWRVALALQADGWWLRSDVIWAKPNPMPESVTDRPTKAHEYLFLMSKSERYYYDAEAVREAAAYPDDGVRVATPKNAAMGLKPTTQYGETTNNGTRNRRTVWQISTQPYSGAHFATFPPALVEPCILAGTSARGVCPACGAGWERVVERTTATPGQKPGYTAGNGTLRNDGERAGHFVDMSTTTTGWRPSCSCDAGEPVPATVLDPFFGSGTVGAVAVETGRNYVGIELNEEYIKLARSRLAGAQPALLAKGLE